MKIMRVLCLLLTMLLLLNGFAFAESGDNDAALSRTEIFDWVKEISNKAKEITAKNAPIGEESKTEFGYAYEYDFATLYYSSPNIDEAELLAVQIVDSVTAGLRGIMCFDDQSKVFEKFPNDNTYLIGDYDMAALYIQDQMPDNAHWGIALRDGQRISTIEYTAHELIENNSYTDLKLSFDIVDGKVNTIGVFGIQDIISQEDVTLNIKHISDIMAKNSYHAYKTSTDGSQLEEFQREDLSFSGIDFLALTPEQAIEKFGKPDTDNTIQDEKGPWYQTLTWDGISITFKLDSNKKLVSTEKIIIRAENIEASRGVRVGDRYPLVFSKFRSGEGQLNNEMKELLYGDGINAPYGIAQYSNNGINLNYAVDVSLTDNEKITIILSMNFHGDVLNEILLYTK